MKYKGTLTIADLEELLPLSIFGAEDDDSDGSDDDAGSDDDQDSSDDNSSSDNEHDDADDPAVKGLRSALSKERAARTKLERELKKQNKAKEEAALAEKSELEQANTRLQASNDKLTKLAAGYLQSKLESAIRDAAKDAKFIDSDDAIAGVDRSALIFEQDEDDPANVTIDSASIKAAVKALATKKPHFISSGTDDGEATGGKFGGRKKKPNAGDDALREKYPALNG